jgi:hypothetical protein
MSGTTKRRIARKAHPACARLLPAVTDQATHTEKGERNE